LDPPLHEFLPEGSIEDIVHMLSSDIKYTGDEILARIEKLSEVNPMLGFRGCRLVSMKFKRMTFILQIIASANFMSHFQF
jgi:phosphoenolpyruvate synthase/pyruvate phosphate dikinase